MHHAFGQLFNVLTLVCLHYQGEKLRFVVYPKSTDCVQMTGIK